MIYKLIVPGPIEDVDQVRILEWHGQEGHSLEEGELVIELETHKALVEVRAGRPGILRTTLCEEGDWVSIGQPLAILSDGPDETLPQSAEDLATMELTFEIS